ncbi:MAG: ribosome maturation factor RimM [Treponemataceae bacterium]|nr:ribosome maturation factor RimM [Treponemataceae bacterium]
MDLTVGFVRGSHGLTGEVRVESASGRYEHIAVLKEVALVQKGISAKYAVENARVAGNVLYVKFAGVDSPEAAKKLNGAALQTSRENACPLKEGEWYVEDLKKCSLVYFGEENGLGNDVAPTDDIRSRSVVGSITDVLEGGAGELLEVLLSEDCDVLKEEVKLNANKKPRTVYVPFNETHVGKVDIPNKSVQLMHLWILE